MAIHLSRPERLVGIAQANSLRIADVKSGRRLHHHPKPSKGPRKPSPGARRRDRGCSDGRRDARNAPDRAASPQEPQGGTGHLLSPLKLGAAESRFLVSFAAAARRWWRKLVGKNPAGSPCREIANAKAHVINHLTAPCRSAGWRLCQGCRSRGVTPLP
jgi:hypothetical protein